MTSERTRLTNRRAAAAWRSRNPDAVAAQRTVERQNYGLTGDDVEALYQAQGSRCAICGVPEEMGRKLTIDHDHATGVVRGLLCRTCNTGLGHLRDSVANLRAAIAYLERAL